ncbi:hypothetical protein FA10DRAFT_268446 [Acaromyces ingoldii]|uniref:BHLH domain-containing protein n=1 Tax=Acaromyces ingoldii TaxID=215250 RepID=A0A316YGI7_9BASI|nr:hypothetical protein FA10DRAFT_268446 [Acaromyces ingoldii]PWN88241.1 hypothetical protein FA10DRAFT_268446 [Acaromyces ingoldii]
MSHSENTQQPYQQSVPAVAENIPAVPKVKKSSGGGNKKGTSAERRATHNAVERARRESLNVRFLELAANLPATSTVRRPSKSLIVNKSLDFVGHALTNETSYRLKIEELMREHRELLDEVNDYRREKGIEPRRSHIDEPSFNVLPAPLADAKFTHNRRASTAMAQGMRLGGDYGNEYGEDDLASGYGSFNGSVEASSPPAGDYSGHNQNASANFEQHGSVEDSPVYGHIQDYSTYGMTQEQGRRASYVSVYSDDHSATSYPQQQPTSAQSDAVHYASNTSTASYMDQPDPRYALPPTAVPLSSSTGGINTAYATSSSRGVTDYMPPITPTTAAVFSNLMNNIDVSLHQQGPHHGHHVNDNGHHYHRTDEYASPSMDSLHSQAPYTPITPHQTFLAA